MLTTAHSNSPTDAIVRRPTLEIESASHNGTATPFALDRSTDRCALASAACSVLGIIPVISQIAGIILGILSLRRIGRARTEGLTRMPAGGSGWAWIGIVVGGIGLLGWLVILGALGMVFGMFAYTANTLDQLPGG